MKTDLSKYDNSWYKQAKSFIILIIWYYTNLFFFRNPYFPFVGFKPKILKLFGAKVGKGVVVKPSVNIKYPWLLEIGEYTWIGEGVWIDNLAMVKIGANVCLSQGAMLLCGNHNYKKSTFDLIVGDITLEDGVWIGAKSIVGPSVHCASHAVLAVNSVASSDLKAYSIYRGNPAEYVKERVKES